MTQQRSCLLILSMAASFAWSGTHAANLGASAQHNVKYTVTEIPAPDNPQCLEGYYRITFARRLNEKAQVVGYDFCYQLSTDPTAPYLGRSTGFRWSRSSGHFLLPPVTPSTVETNGRDINEAGTTVGWAFSSNGVRAPIWPISGGVADIITPSTCRNDDLILTRAEDINDHGAIALSDLRSVDGTCRSRWVLKLPSGAEIVGPPGTPRGLNNDGLMVGESGVNAVKWKPGEAEVILASGNPSSPRIWARAWAVSECGETVGYVERFGEGGNTLVSSEAKFWSVDGVERTLPGLAGSTRSWARDINSNSTIVGQSQLGDGSDPLQERGVVWNNGRATDLNKLIPAARAQEILITQGTSINDRGQILAMGYQKDEALKPCPEYVFDPVTGEEYYDTTRTCRSIHSYLLTPK